MRDTDRDLTSVVVVRADSPVATLCRTGRHTSSPRAPSTPRRPPSSPWRCWAASRVQVRRFEVGVGLHGDHIGGERDAARALAAGEVDAACMIDANHLLFTTEGTLPAGRHPGRSPRRARIDHCNMTVAGPTSPLLDRFASLLLGMDYADPAVRPLLDLEGLTRWLPGRTVGLRPARSGGRPPRVLRRQGQVTADGYRP